MLQAGNVISQNILITETRPLAAAKEIERKCDGYQLEADEKEKAKDLTGKKKAKKKAKAKVQKERQRARKEKEKERLWKFL